MGVRSNEKSKCERGKTMTNICPKCMQPLPEEKENESDVTLQQFLHDDVMGRVVGAWGRLGYVTEDDLNKRKFVDIHAAHVGAFLNLLHLKRSFDAIETYDNLGYNSSEQNMNQFQGIESDE